MLSFLPDYVFFGGICWMKPFRLIAAPMLLCSMLLLTGCAELFPKSGQNVNTVPPTVPAGETTSVLPEDWVVPTAPDRKSVV